MAINKNGALKGLPLKYYNNRAHAGDGGNRFQGYQPRGWVALVMMDTGNEEPLKGLHFPYVFCVLGPFEPVCVRSRF